MYKKYYVTINEKEKLGKRLSDGKILIVDDTMFGDYDYQLTLNEIKAYDEKYLRIAVESQYKQQRDSVIKHLNRLTESPSERRRRMVEDLRKKNKQNRGKL